MSTGHFFPIQSSVLLTNYPWIQSHALTNRNAAQFISCHCEESFGKTVSWFIWPVQAVSSSGYISVQLNLFHLYLSLNEEGCCAHMASSNDFLETLWSIQSCQVTSCRLQSKSLTREWKCQSNQICNQIWAVMHQAAPNAFEIWHIVKKNTGASHKHWNHVHHVIHAARFSTALAVINQ